MERMTFLGALTAILGFGFLAGCSLYVYQEEVLQFNEGIQQASTTFELQKEFLKETGVALNRNDLIDAGSPRLMVPDSCVDIVACLGFSATVRKQECAQFLEAPPQARTVETDEPQDDYVALLNRSSEACQVEAADGQDVEQSLPLKKQKAVLDGLTAYGTALEGIVNAQDRTALDNATTQACSSTQTVFGSVAQLNISEEGDDLTPEEQAALAEREARIAKEETAVNEVCGLVGNIGAGLLDAQRLKALRDVVNAADPNIRILSGYLRVESRTIDNMMIRHEFETLQQSVDNTVGLQEDGNAYITAIDAAVEKNKAFVDFLDNNSAKVFAQMGVAHTKLKDAVNDPATQLEAAIVSIDAFSTSAKLAHDAVEALSEKDDDSE